MSRLNLQGLSEKEAKIALFRFGKNQLVQKKKISAWVRYLRYFKNPLIIILVVCAVLSTLFGESRSATLIVAMILLSTLLNYYQEQKSGSEAEKLQEKISLIASVVRGGIKKDISAELIVPGDVVFLSAGNIVPADGGLVSAESLFVNEAALTGESFPVEKEGSEEKDCDKKSCLVHAGTNVVSGSGYLIVRATGSNTEFGKIASSIAEESPPDAFEKGITNFGFLIVKATVFIVITVFLIIVFKPLLNHTELSQADLVQSFLFALAIAVGLTPELLPMIMSLNMTKGSLRMAKHGVIVKRLNAIPDFGSIDILCTDKTGTLTEDTITLVKYVDIKGAESDSVLRYAYVNSVLQTGLKNPLDNAILNFKHLSVKNFHKLKEIPYDFYRKRISVIVNHENNHELITKGQPEEIIKISTHFELNGAVHKISEDFLKDFATLYRQMSEQGFKTLAVARRHFPERKHSYDKNDECEMVVLGFIGFFDPPKQTAAETVKTLFEHGVEVKIITGDNEWVTKKICTELKIEIKGILIGDETLNMTEEELAHRAENITIFARFTPEQKRRVIVALRSLHKVVGYLGDGINDAPSLKAADIGISVSNAADVAKETADIILSHKSLHELGQGIIEGRKTFGNTLKYLMMGLSSNFGNMFSLIGAAIFLPFLPILPFQVLLNNSLYDLSQTTIPSDHVDGEYLKKPKHWDAKFMRKFMIVFGLMSSIFDFATFYMLYGVFHLGAASFHTGWFIESLATQTLVIYIIRTRKLFFTSRPSTYLIVTTLLVVGAGFILPYTFMGAYFSFEPLPPVILGSIVGLVTMYLVLVEGVKHLFYRLVPTSD
ncbi:MAG: magnesium-translocating P-type ATPase [Patescibacteria group bacterium]|jgi:Mg2+-importing ATPase